MIGARAWRVLFAGISLPLAVVAVFYFINHRYDGAALWDIRSVPGVHDTLWVVNFVSFLLLYPSTFNLLEVAAVDKPKLHLWESGVMRITRHPQVCSCLCVVATLFSDFSLLQRSRSRGQAKRRHAHHAAPAGVSRTYGCLFLIKSLRFERHHAPPAGAFLPACCNSVCLVDKRTTPASLGVIRAHD